jgi:thiamine-monophosphate kinase
MNDSSDKRTELSSVGEFTLIKRLMAPFQNSNASTILGVGDDAAVIEHDSDQQLVITTDLLVEGIHFDLSYTPLKHLGYKAVAVNISDVCAMNARAAQIVMSIGVSNRFSVEALEELYAGVHRACGDFGVDLVGGDTSSSIAGMILSVSAYGYVLPEKLVKRSGAQIHDILVVSGDLGGAYMGLQVLEREKEVFRSAPGAQPQLENYAYILERQLKPQPRVDIVDLLEDLGVVPTSMIDISDGLASEVLHLCDSSEKGAMLYEEKIPIAPETIEAAKEFNLDYTTAALNGGEDYELLFTIRPSDWDKIKGNPNFSAIGHITEEHLGTKLITNAGEQVELQAQGWNAFRSKN